MVICPKWIFICYCELPDVVGHLHVSMSFFSQRFLKCMISKIILSQTSLFQERNHLSPSQTPFSLCLRCSQCVCMHQSLNHVWLFPIPWTVACQAPLSILDTGMGCHSLLQSLFLIQGPNPGLPHRGEILYHLNHHGSPFRYK